jgi:hypothetical protein
MNQRHLDQTTLRYEHLIENHLEHLKRRYDLLVDADTLPQFWFLTVTFLPVLEADEQFRTQAAPTTVDLCLH